MIKYLGSKRTLLPLISGVIDALPDARTAIDLFAGTSRVGQAMKRAGLRVIANDQNAYAATLARCYVQADRDDVVSDAQKLIAEFNTLPGRAGYVTDTFCERSRFFQPKNGARIDAIREAIVDKGLGPDLEAVCLVSLMEAADRVDSTCGVQMAYLKEWSQRAHHDLALRLPELLPRPQHGRCLALQHDAIDVVTDLSADVLYLDPPYNQHSYLGNYHVWESLVLWDKPAVYGKACKRTDNLSRKSAFNRKTTFKAALEDVIRHADARLLLVSFNNEGFIAREEMEALLSTRGPVHVIATDYQRYVGARIGIHNPSGEVVGAVSHLRNLEYLYIVDIADNGIDWAAVARHLQPTAPVGTSTADARRARRARLAASSKQRAMPGPMTTSTHLTDLP